MVPHSPVGQDPCDPDILLDQGIRGRLERLPPQSGQGWIPAFAGMTERNYGRSRPRHRNRQERVFNVKT